MNPNRITLEKLTEANFSQIKRIRREDISEDFVDSADTLMELTLYGSEHHCLGCTYAIKYGRAYIGVLLLGEALAWATDPVEMQGVPFYRLMGFVLDKRCRGNGIGGIVLEMAIADCFRSFGARPIALGCHRDNQRAADFYLRHGFVPNLAMDGNDRYYLRYPES